MSEVIENVDEPIEQPQDVSHETPAEQEVEKKAPVSFDEDQQAVFEKAIHKKVAVTNEQRARADKAELALKELQDKQPKAERPEIPDLPDQYSQDFVQENLAREQAIAARATFDAGAKIRSENALAQQQQQQLKQQQAYNNAVTEYMGRSETLGIKADDLNTATAQVNAYNIPDALAGHIMDDPNGPQIVMYLSKNPSEMETLFTMNPMEAAAKIATSIKPLAMKATKQTDFPDDPAESLKGTGTRSQEGVPDVIYE